MAVYVSLVFLLLSLVTLVLGNHPDRRRHHVRFGVAVTFLALAGTVMIGSAVRSLWLYPLS